ncbi:hypothetical protein Tco_1271369 [Tanacetum coccineum]
MFGFKECSSCGVLYNRDPCCSNVSSVDNSSYLPPQTQTNSSESFVQWSCNHCKKLIDPIHGYRCPCSSCEVCGYNLCEGICLYCKKEAETLLDNNPNSFNTPSNSSDHPPQPQYPTYTCELCGNEAHYGYDCSPQVLFDYNQNLGEKIDDEYERDYEIKIKQLLQDYNGLDIEMRKKERILMEEKSLAISRRIQSICDDDEDDSISLRDIYARYSTYKAITPDLPTKEPDNSLSMGDEHLDTIPSVENLVPIPSEFKGNSEDMCDVPVCEDPSTFDALNDHSEILSDSNDDGTSSDDDDFEDIDRLITNIESLNDNSSPDHVFKSLSSVHIPVTDSDSFFEESDTSFSHLDNSLPKFEPFSDDMEEARSGSTTTHANNPLSEYD